MTGKMEAASYCELIHSSKLCWLNDAGLRQRKPKNATSAVRSHGETEIRSTLRGNSPDKKIEARERIPNSSKSPSQIQGMIFSGLEISSRAICVFRRNSRSALRNAKESIPRIQPKMCERLYWKNEHSSHSLSCLSHGHHRPCMSSTFPLTQRPDPVQGCGLRLFHIAATKYPLILLSICTSCPLFAWHEVGQWAVLVSSRPNGQHTYRSGIDLRLPLDATGIDIPWLCSQCSADHSNALANPRSYSPLPCYSCFPTEPGYRIVACSMTTYQQIELLAWLKWG